MAKTRQSAPTSAQQRLAAQRAAAARERIQAAQRRRRIVVVASVVSVLVLVAAVLVIVKVADGNSVTSGKKASAASGSLTSKLASVPASVFDSVGKGSSSTPPSKIDGTSLTGSNGKPEVFYVGAEFCPYCAAERWPIAVALSRFGTFHDLGEVRSSPSDYAPNTATLTFHGATYTSQYLSFVGKEIYTNQAASNGYYTTLDTLTSSQMALFKKYTGGSFPFAYLDGKYAVAGAQYAPTALSGLNQTQIVDDLTNASSPITKDIVGSANVITAALCDLTGGKPANVCTSSGVTTAAAALPTKVTK